MLLEDHELDKLMKELYKMLNPSYADKISSYLYSVSRQVEELRKSRDNWKEKYKKLKDE